MKTALTGLCVAFAALAADAPRKIVVLSPNITEMLYGMGALAQVVGVSDFSTYPPEVAKIARVGGWENPSFERVTALRPDLVIVDDAQASLVADNFRKLGLHVMSVKDRTILEAYDAMAALGRAAGHQAEAGKLIASTREGLARVSKKTSGVSRPSVVLIVDRTPGTLRDLYTATAGGYLGELIEISGGRMALAAAQSGYGQLSKEDLLAADPDWILDLNHKAEGRMAGDPLAAWNEMPQLKAVRKRQVRIVTEDFVVHSSQRMVETAELFARLIHPELR